MKKYKFLSFTSFLIIIIIWCAITYGGLVAEMFVPSPTAVIDKIAESATDGSLWANCWVSTKRVMIGWALAAVISLPCGMIMAKFWKGKGEMKSEDVKAFFPTLDIK